MSLPATILIASIILGGIFYAIQINKQQSIERQQEIKLQEDRRIEEVKTEQEHKEYIAKRKMECYDIYEKERDKWNNVKSNFYREEDDVCVVKYENNKYNEAICEEKLKEDDDIDDIDDICFTMKKGILVHCIHTECEKYFTKEY